MSTVTSVLDAAIFPAKPDVRLGVWADRRPGKLHHQLALGVFVALMVCAFVRFLMEGRTVCLRLRSALQPWAQRAPPLFQRH